MAVTTTFALIMKDNGYWIYDEESACPQFHKRLTWPTLTEALEWATNVGWERNMISVVEIESKIVRTYQ